MALLGLLSSADLHGYDLKQLCDRLVSPGRAIKQGQVYATLHRLERDGCISVAAVEQEEGPERRRYTLTTIGRTQVDDWLNTPEPAAPHLQSALYAKVIVALVAGFAVERLIESQRSAHMARMRELTITRRAGALPEVILADYALFHLEADLRWLDTTSARIAQVRDQVEQGMSGLGMTMPSVSHQGVAR